MSGSHPRKDWGATARGTVAPLRFFSTSQLRRLRDGEQVAAVCYRIGDRGIEFLLVKTRSGRWTFPKGGAEPGLTLAQAAALEAFEEAGVHGRMEESSFARYMRRGRRTAGKEFAIHAHLCEVTRLSTPQESERYPTWFSPDKAKRRLRVDRGLQDGIELAQVVDRAVSRIERLRYLASAPADSLQKVQFEAGAEVSGQVSRASFVRFIRRRSADQMSGPIELAVNAQLSKVLRFSAPPRAGQPALLLSGTTAKQFGNGKRSRQG